MRVSEKKIWIQGLGRSGTSWLQKTFDHHPSVLSLFEPEARMTEIPGPSPVPPEYTDATLKTYTGRLFRSRDLRAVKKRPILRKEYRSRTAHAMRVAMIFGAQATETLGRKLGARDVRLAIPDLVERPPSHRVVKCVATPYPFDDIVASNPEVRFIFIVRHPCAVAHSAIRGMNMGKMSAIYLPRRYLLERFYSFEDRPRRVTETDFSPEEVVAYRWGVYNGLAMGASSSCPNIRIIRYEDLCADPIATMRDLFDWVELDWHSDCETFLQMSLDTDGDAAGYHSFNRNPSVAATKWKHEFSPASQERVTTIAGQSPAAELFPDLINRRALDTHLSQGVTATQ